MRVVLNSTMSSAVPACRLLPPRRASRREPAAPGKSERGMAALARLTRDAAEAYIDHCRGAERKLHVSIGWMKLKGDDSRRFRSGV